MGQLRSTLFRHTCRKHWNLRTGGLAHQRTWGYSIILTWTLRSGLPSESWRHTFEAHSGITGRRNSDGSVFMPSCCAGTSPEDGSLGVLRNGKIPSVGRRGPEVFSLLVLESCCWRMPGLEIWQGPKEYSTQFWAEVGIMQDSVGQGSSPAPG